MILYILLVIEVEMTRMADGLTKRQSCMQIYLFPLLCIVEPFLLPFVDAESFRDRITDQILSESAIQRV